MKYILCALVLVTTGVFAAEGARVLPTPEAVQEKLAKQYLELQKLDPRFAPNGSHFTQMETFVQANSKWMFAVAQNVSEFNPYLLARDVVIGRMARKSLAQGTERDEGASLVDDLQRLRRENEKLQAALSQVSNKEISPSNFEEWKKDNKIVTRFFYQMFPEFGEGTDKNTMLKKLIANDPELLQLYAQNPGLALRLGVDAIRKMESASK